MDDDDFLRYWVQFARAHGYDENLRGLMYKGFYAGWVAARTEDRKIVTGGEEWRLWSNDQA